MIYALQSGLTVAKELVNILFACIVEVAPQPDAAHALHKIATERIATHPDLTPAQKEELTGICRDYVTLLLEG